jgi:group I intron endonuclease
MTEYQGTAIYKITNTINNKIYIGSAKNFYKRYLKHKENPRETHISRSFRKYGFENFVFEILETPDIFNLIEREQFWMDFYQSYNKKIGYNTRIKAESNLGFKHSIETRQKISNSQKGKPRKNANSYRVYTDEQRSKFKLTMFNLKHDWKPILQLDLMNNIIKEFPSLSQAGRDTGFNYKGISKCARGERKRAYGFVWKYKDNINSPI